MEPTSGPAGGASDCQRPGDAGKGPGWGGQICSRGVSKPSHGSYPCLEGMDSVTTKVDWVLRAGRPGAGSGGGVSTAIQKGLVAKPARGRQAMGGISAGARFPRSPWASQRGPVGGGQGGPLGQHRAATPEAPAPARRADPQRRQVSAFRQEQ